MVEGNSSLSSPSFSSQESWLIYIRAINERARTKRNASGLTNWALFGTLAITLYAAIDHASSLSKDSQSLVLALPTLAATVNIAAFLVVAFSSIASAFSFSSPQPRLQSNLTSAARKVVMPTLYILFLGLASFEITLALVGPPYQVSRWPLFTCGVLYIVMVVVPATQSLLARRTFRKNTKGRLVQPLAVAKNPLLESDRTRQLIVILTAAIALIPLASSIFLFRDLFVHSQLGSNPDVIM